MKNYINNTINQHLLPRPDTKISFIKYSVRDKELYIIKIHVDESNIKPVILKYASDSGSDIEIIDIVETLLDEINSLDKNGDNFRYPTSYSLEYRFDNKIVDLKNIYEYNKAIINFLDGCDSMLDAIADYEAEMRAEYESEMRANMEWY